MNNLSDIGLGISVSWKQAMKTKAFRNRLISAHVFLVSVILILPHFFDFIEQREGILLIDPLLNLIPTVDLSLPVFVCIAEPQHYYYRGVHQTPACILRMSMVL